jgi:hypothetical protein
MLGGTEVLIIVVVLVALVLFGGLILRLVRRPER